MKPNPVMTAPGPYAGPSPNHQQPAPIAAESRLLALDVLRGVALLGILVMNIDDFWGPEALHDIPVGIAKAAFTGWHAHLDATILAIKWVFFEGRMRTLFAMLYGAGIVLLMGRLEQGARKRQAKSIFYRRNLWLLLFGVLHGVLIWHGDILSQYAVEGMIVVFFRKLSARTLVILGLAIGIVGGSIGIANLTGMFDVMAAADLTEQGKAALAAHQPVTPAQSKAMADAAEAARQAPVIAAQNIREGQAPYLQSIGIRVKGYFGFLIVNVQTGLISEVIGSMLLGMGLFKNGFLLGQWSRRRYMAIATGGYVMASVIVLYGLHRSAQAHFAEAVFLKWTGIPFYLQNYPACLANVSLVLLIVKSGYLRPATNALANVGRMAFSNYILTSVLCQWLFVWSGWGLYGNIEYYQQVWVILGVWAINLAVSALWLRSYRFGPLEWAWRSLTYWRAQPLLRTDNEGAIPGRLA